MNNSNRFHFYLNSRGHIYQVRVRLRPGVFWFGELGLEQALDQPASRQLDPGRGLLRAQRREQANLGGAVPECVVALQLGAARLWPDGASASAGQAG